MALDQPSEPQRTHTIIGGAVPQADQPPVSRRRAAGPSGGGVSENKTRQLSAELRMGAEPARQVQHPIGDSGEGLHLGQ